ncbi:DUF2125 domain-containing protein [Rhodoligotrophos defluvii]|uniref:DUF2125 domain-containing protein n=1 Tax=Rhodoligotrophos defluvii TaxID=2561934 RepID=UPI001484CF2F|nr:DUF2125 domain-containing protein [Rhodoligotrophos defluvii]
MGPWRVALPLIGVLVLFALWSGYWWYVSQMSRNGFERWVHEVVQRGMTVSCGEQQWGGYPFRVEMSCAPLQLSWTNSAGAGSIDLGRLESVFQVYNPRHVLAAASAPASYRIGASGGGAPNALVSATFAPATASLVLANGGFARSDLVVRELVADFGGAEGFGAQGRARSLELHSRFVQRDETAPMILEIAGTAEDISLAGPAVTYATGIPIALDAMTLRAEMDGAFTAAVDPSTALRAFVASGGKVRITQLNGRQGKVTIDATGELTFDSDGQANGELDSTVVNLKSILDQLREAGRLGELEAAFSLNMLSMLEGATSGREGSLRVKVVIKDGNVYFGPFKILELPPLF